MSQKLPVDSFKWVKDLSKFNESFIKNYNENNDKDLPFLPERKKIRNVISLCVPCKTKKIMLFT